MPKQRSKDIPTLSDASYRELLFKHLNEGDQRAHAKTVFWEYLNESFAIQKGRAIRLHDLYYAQWCETRKKYQDRELEKQSAAAAKKGLNTRLDRLMFYQKQVSKMEKQLDGKAKFTFVVNGRIMKSHDGAGNFVAPVQVLNEIRRQIRDYQAEISRAEGDYAPVKTDITSGGKAIKKSVIKTSTGDVIEF